MLRASIAHAQEQVNLAAVAGKGDSGLPHGAALAALAEAAVDASGVGLESARNRLRSEAGTAFMNDAIAVIANFEMMTRVADLTGSALDQNHREHMTGVIDIVGAAEFDTVRWG